MKVYFARYGGLSSVKQNHFQSNEDNMFFHTAPERKGIYAFLWPYIDWFLLSGDTGKLKEKGEFKNKHEQLIFKMKKFTVKKGFIWIHTELPLKYQYMIVEEKGSWKKIDIQDYEFILPKIFAKRAKQGYNSFLEFSKSTNINPTHYKKFFKWFSTDDLEVFIPRKTIIS